MPANVEPGTATADAHFMRMALAEAHAAQAAGEIPVGAVIVREGQVIAQGRNAPIACNDPTAHAEIAVLRAAAQALGNYRLDACTLYVTLEPCAMCAGAMLHARVGRLVFGAADPKTGAAGSVINLFGNPRINHQTTVTGGVLAAACAQLLTGFFEGRRGKNPAPLRDDALRTPEAAFALAPPVTGEARYFLQLPTLAGLRLHAIDAGPHGAMACLCLHDACTWSALFEPLVAELAAAGQRVIAPDLIGFGRSDKPKRAGGRPLRWHAQILSEMLDALHVSEIIVIAHGAATHLALQLASLRPLCVRAIVRFPGATPSDRLGRPRNSRAGRVPPDNAATLKRLRLHWIRLAPMHATTLLAPYPQPAYAAGIRDFLQALSDDALPTSEGNGADGESAFVPLIRIAPLEGDVIQVDSIGHDGISRKLLGTHAIPGADDPFPEDRPGLGMLALRYALTFVQDAQDAQGIQDDRATSCPAAPPL